MSARSLPITLAPRARRDYEGILLHSLQEWGEEQQERYEAAFARAFAILSDNPNLGRAREELYPGCRSYLVEQHIVYYEVRPRSIRVARILHTRADARRALRPRA